MHYQVLNIEPLLEDFSKRITTENADNELEWYSFPQGWSDTSLGFGGAGGQMMCGAQTVIVGNLYRYGVYFGGRFAYLVERPNETFFEDMHNWKMADIRRSGKYKRAV